MIRVDSIKIKVTGKATGTETSCFFCRRVVKDKPNRPSWWVHVHGGGEVILLPGQDPLKFGYTEAADMGLHRMGGECVKKIDIDHIWVGVEGSQPRPLNPFAAADPIPEVESATTRRRLEASEGQAAAMREALDGAYTALEGYAGGDPDQLQQIADALAPDAGRGVLERLRRAEARANSSPDLKEAEYIMQLEDQRRDLREERDRLKARLEFKTHELSQMELVKDRAYSGVAEDGCEIARLKARVAELEAERSNKWDAEVGKEIDTRHRQGREYEAEIDRLNAGVAGMRKALETLRPAFTETLWSSGTMAHCFNGLQAQHIIDAALALDPGADVEGAEANVEPYLHGVAAGDVVAAMKAAGWIAPDLIAKVRAEANDGYLKLKNGWSLQTPPAEVSYAMMRFHDVLVLLLTTDTKGSDDDAGTD